MTPMNNKFTRLAGVVITCAVLSACSGTDVSNPPPLNSGTPSSGSADFTKYVSLGDSITAGYADGALYLLGQQNSFPSILAQQMAAADDVAVDFVQPLLAHDLANGIDGNLGALNVDVFGPLIEARFVLNTETESPERLEGAATDNVVGTGLNGTPFNNMGVPGAKSFHLPAAGYGAIVGLPAAANPYFTRFAMDEASSSIVGDAAAQTPSFYTLWIGNNDVLGDATSGGDGTDPVTDTATFDASYAGIVAAMKGANAAVQGVLINIPDVSTIPFFTAVPYNAIPLDQATADVLNDSYAAYNAAIQGVGLTPEEIAQRTISFAEGQNAIVIEDEDLTDLTLGGLPSMRQATASDLIVLPAGAYLGTEDMNQAGATPPAGMPWGVGTPLVDSDVLIPSEIAVINAAQTAFNATIKATADADANLVFFDAAAVMTELSTNGINYGTGSINADFATGGAFSLDGVHPTARGYAVIANEIIDVMNAGFDANIFKVDPATYPTVFLK